jgi:hypothetical protein
MGMDVSEEPALHMVVVRFLETLEPIRDHNPEDHNVALTFFVNNIGVRIWINKVDTSTWVKRFQRSKITSKLTNKTCGITRNHQALT